MPILGGDPVNTPPNFRFRTRDQNIARFEKFFIGFPEAQP